MARYIGPKSKIARKFKDPIYGPDKYVEKKNYPPGQHGVTKKRGTGKISEYGIQLQEKQKAKYTYGVLEKQFKNIFLKAASKKGITGEELLQLLESRLDNVVYRLGIAPTRAGARQLVSHKHIVVNGEVVSIPSFTLRAGDIVGVREKSKASESILDSLSSHSASRYPWLEWDGNSMSGKYMMIPSRDLIPENIQEQLIIELYSK
ncbi:MAG: 30S ribosomal protein S4 [Bacteroidales bacterium]|nr:30S ribosomal protein S4 [Bacteroidales bacterium]MDD4208962.1 30S ribosomal protein S4 [Bacteroidales bacterium]